MTTLEKASVFFAVGVLAFIMGFIVDPNRTTSFTPNFNPYVAVGLVLFLIGALIPLRKKLGF